MRRRELSAESAEDPVLAKAAVIPGDAAVPETQGTDPFSSANPILTRPPLKFEFMVCCISYRMTFLYEMTDKSNDISFGSSGKSGHSTEWV